jgi:2-iminobutanoate/2-iminopropanoate deaminase
MPDEAPGHGVPKPVGPYSPVREADGWIFLSGQIGLSPKTGHLVEGGIREETHQVLENIRTLLESCGSEWASCVKTTIFLVDMKDFSTVNEIYESILEKPYPARSTIGVKELPKGARVEIEAIAKRLETKIPEA